MTSCSESKDVEGEFRSLCDKMDVFFPQFAGNAAEMVAMWKWKVKSETVSSFYPSAKRGVLLS